LAPIFKFGSDNRDTPDPDTIIPANEREEQFLAGLAQLIPTGITKPHFESLGTAPSFASRMSQIAATTTLTSESLLGRALGLGVPAGGSTSANIIRKTLGGGGSFGGGPPGGGPPNVPAGGGDPADPNHGPPAGGPPGGGGDPGAAGGGRDPERPSDKLIGREPEIFNGDRTKVETFLTEWNIYRVLNDRTKTMINPLERTMLFLTYIRGPNIGNWINDQVSVVSRHIRSGGSRNDEFIWDTVMQEFATTFQDLMSQERAESKLKTLRMEGGNLDEYTAEFKRLARLAEYDLNERLVGHKYFDGLPEGLRRAIVADTNMNLLVTTADYIDAAIRFHCKYLQWQSFFDRSSQNKKPTKQQWQQRFAKDPNAMDLTPGLTHARAAMSDEEMAKLRQEGKCFKCRRQGHIGCNCPNKNQQNPQVRATNTSTASSGPSNTTNATIMADNAPKMTPPASIKRITAQELVGLVRNMEQDEKDKVIQDVFMNEDFC
jgi:hypothetical protein